MECDFTSEPAIKQEPMDSDPFNQEVQHLSTDLHHSNKLYGLLATEQQSFDVVAGANISHQVTDVGLLDQIRANLDFALRHEEEKLKMDSSFQKHNTATQVPQSQLEQQSQKRKRKSFLPRRITQSELDQVYTPPGSDMQCESKHSDQELGRCFLSETNEQNQLSDSIFNGEYCYVLKDDDGTVTSNDEQTSEGNRAEQQETIPENLTEDHIIQISQVVSYSATDENSDAAEVTGFEGIPDTTTELNQQPVKKRRKSPKPVPYTYNEHGTKVYKCDSCEKVFLKSSGLVSHRRIHSGETPFTCEFCNKQFNVKSNLTMHLRIHTGELPFSCAICNKGFKQSSQLTSHLRCHTGELPFSCHLCEKPFRNKSALTTHLRIHTGERPYECEICHKTFAVVSSLKSHRVTHTAEKPFQCQICNHWFNRRNNLNTHIKSVHASHPSHTCQLCGKLFVQRGHLLLHQRKTHKIKNAYASHIDREERIKKLTTVKGANFDKYPISFESTEGIIKALNLDTSSLTQENKEDNGKVSHAETFQNNVDYVRIKVEAS